MTSIPTSQEDFLLFLPDKVASVTLEIKETVTERLLKRNLEAFDWHLQDLWRVAVYYTLNDSPLKALPYYYKLLQWTENDPQAHSDVLCGTAHVFSLQKQYKDALNMFQVALKKAHQPGKIPFFIARLAYLMGLYPQALHALSDFLEHYTQTNTLRLHALSMQLMICDQAGNTASAQHTLEQIALDYPTWESHFMASTFSPYIPSLIPVSLDSAHHEEILAQEHCYKNPQHMPLIAWFLPHFYKRLDNPSAAESLQVYKRLRQNIQQRMAFLAEQTTALSLTTSPTASESSLRIAMIGNFEAPSLQCLSPLLVGLCRQHSITLFSAQPFPLDLSEEHWIKTVLLSDDIQTAYTQVKNHQPDIILYLHHAHSSKQVSFLSNFRIAPYQVLWATEPGIFTDPGLIDEVLIYEKTLPEKALPIAFHSFQKVTKLPGDPVKKSAHPEQDIPATAFNFKPDQHHYLCPFSIIDLHPHFFHDCDELLQADPQGNVFFLASNTPEGERTWREQLNKTFPETAHRMHILPPLNRVHLAAVAQHVDVLLDPPHTPLKHLWWQHLPLGTPIISFERDSWNGDWVKGLYTAMQWQGFEPIQTLTPVQQACYVAQHPDIKKACVQHMTHKPFEFSQLEAFLSHWLKETLAAQTRSVDTIQ